MILRIGLKAVFFSKDKILLLKRAEDISRGGKWDLPGGLLEEGENLFEGLKREVFEETGIYLKKTYFPLDVGYFNQGIYRYENVIRVIYLCKTEKRRIVLCPEHTRYRWFSFDQLHHIDQKDFISPRDYKRILERAEFLIQNS